MKKISKIFLMTALLLAVAVTLAAGEKAGTFSPYVDSKGGISIPLEFRSVWAHAGTWVLTSTLAAGLNHGLTSPRAGIHNVYTQPESLKSYKQNGKWPDGAVLVMEVRELKWNDLSTGHVIEEGPALQWFVMVKDAKGRFPGNPNWGSGWGWALFKPGNAPRNEATDCRNDCLGCHETAKSTDWTFTQGDQALR